MRSWSEGRRSSGMVYAINSIFLSVYLFISIFAVKQGKKGKTTGREYANSEPNVRVKKLYNACHSSGVILLSFVIFNVAGLLFSILLKVLFDGEPRFEFFAYLTYFVLFHVGIHLVFLIFGFSIGISGLEICNIYRHGSIQCSKYKTQYCVSNLVIITGIATILYLIFQCSPFASHIYDI